VREELKTIGFAAAVCVVCSLLLSLVYSATREEQEANRELDRLTKVLSVFGHPLTDEQGRMLGVDQVKQVFHETIETVVLDHNAEPADIDPATMTTEQINDRSPDTGHKDYYPLYVYTDPASGRRRYAIHISGMGLWSVIKGYLALDQDLRTITGIVFYEHGETPGLGGEIDKPAFTEQFIGKQLLSPMGEVQYFDVLKAGKEADRFSVEGISGATMTGKGLAEFLNDDFAVYNVYLSKLRD
jgi:Na+-transporting NADH:ubiquinone oxidoreductase subunit C